MYCNLCIQEIASGKLEIYTNYFLGKNMVSVVENYAKISGQIYYAWLEPLTIEEFNSVEEE